MPYIAPGSDDLNPEEASFNLETGEDQQGYVLQVVEDDQTYNVPIDDNEQFDGVSTLSDDGSGGALVTLTADDVSGYSTTAAALHGKPSEVYKGVVDIESLATDPRPRQSRMEEQAWSSDRVLLFTPATRCHKPNKANVPYKLVEVSAPKIQTITIPATTPSHQGIAANPT